MRLPVVLLLLGLNPVMAPLIAQDPVDFQGWLNQGIQAFQSAQYPQAVAAFQRAVQIQPDHVAAHLYLGTAYMQQYIPGATSPQNEAMARFATDQFLRVVNLESNNKVALASLGSLSLNQKKWDEAQKWYDTLAGVDPNNADAYYSMGFIAWSKWYPEYGKARMSLGMKPQDPGPIKDFAVREKLKADYGAVIEAGVQALEKALQINPQYADAMAYMNLLIRERADLRDTADEYRQDIAAADDWVQKALAAKKQRAENWQRSGAASGMTPQRITIGGNVQELKLVNRTPPVYPPLALQARISGVVHLAAIIGKDGRVLDLKAIGGHPLLIPSALEAVKQWVYQPTLLNGIPVEVATQVDVLFTLP
ncbi:MAG TPA: tetratricopeptide repeat protein [Candidatus Acidoferrales bacterium]|jgi:TonB family protein|nr:tetratricopeptide repeat protein [Candidatus Acidoferrales bacterium]